MSDISVALVGASGYAGGELARLLARHPRVALTQALSKTYAGQPLARAFPGLAGTPAGALVCRDGDVLRAASSVDAFFLAQESGFAMKVAGELLALGKRVVDLSADFRLRDVSAYESWYKIRHDAAQLLGGTAVYGLTERNRERIAGAALIANPGCYPTAALLALSPLLERNLIARKGIVIDAKSGVSGAGRAKSDPVYRFSEANESVRPYGVGGVHRHVPEIEQELRAVAGAEALRIAFTPHLIPMTRGMLATCYAPATPGATLETVAAALREAYAGSPFVVIREPGDYPSTKEVYGSNFCHLCPAFDARTGTVIVLSVIDNLIKGAAGQAVQNLNVMYGLPETAGLEGGGLWP